MATLLLHIDEFKARLDLVKKDGKIDLGEALGLASVIAHAAACTLDKLSDPSRTAEITNEAIELYRKYVTAEAIDIPWLGEAGEAVVLGYAEGIIRQYIEKAVDWINGGQ